LHTPFHIDYSWWTQNDREWRVYLRSLLCPTHQESFVDLDEDETIDWVNPETAEVQRVDGLQHILLSHCSQQDGFLQQGTAIVEATFRLFMKNQNQPMTITEVGEALNRPAKPILRTLSGSRVYKGLRPIIEK
jgi:hypothetical protein